MKKFFFSILSVLFLALSFVACDSAENNLHFTGTFPNVFDVKKSYIYPSFADTSYFIKDIADYGLSSGDRAYILMDYEFNPYSMKLPNLSIGYVITKITRRELSRKGDVDFTRYNSPFKHKTDVVEFYEMGANGELQATHESDFLWADAETQNIVLCYKKGLNCSPRMVVDSLRKKDVGNVLYFRLYADIADRGWIEEETFSYDNDPEKVYKIFSYNMDWDVIKSELTAEEQALLVKCDSLTSCISAVVEGCKLDDDGMYIPQNYLTNDKFANPLYKK